MRRGERQVTEPNMIHFLCFNYNIKYLKRLPIPAFWNVLVIFRIFSPFVCVFLFFVLSALIRLVEINLNPWILINVQMEPNRGAPKVRCFKINVYAMLIQNFTIFYHFCCYWMCQSNIMWGYFGTLTRLFECTTWFNYYY